MSMAVGKVSISEKDFERIMKALANQRRLAILRFLKTKKEVNVGDIAEEIKLSFKATSKHLGVLYAAGVVDREQRSLQMFYHLSLDIPLPARSIVFLL